MKKRLCITISILFALLICAAYGGSSIYAAESGDFPYSVYSGTATITGYSGSSLDVNIPSVLNGYPVVAIGQNAFRNCSSLTSITIPEGVTSIGNHAFSYCRGLTSITIPNSVTNIDVRTFYGCSSLTSITIPEGVTTIGELAFGACNDLTTITIPDSVVSIGSSAFSQCNGLTNVTIPDSVTDIAAGAFGGCSSLTSITIPDGVSSIGASTFVGCSSLAVITMPDSVTSIGDYAFYGCSSLVSIAIPDAVIGIGKYAFGQCGSLTDITIPDSVASIGDSSFSHCSNLVDITIPNSVTSIGNYVFCECNSLADITIPDSVTSIGNSAFYGCSSLTNITIPNSVISIGDEAFRGCSKLISVTIPDGVSSIGSYTFSGCGKLTNIQIPDSVTIIGSSAFENCRSLTNIQIPDSVTSIGGSAFSHCSSLTNIQIPDSVTSIGGSAFSHCSSLVDITIPDGVTSIWYSAFYGCSSLTNITIPNSVISIGDEAFRGCSKLISVTIPNTVTNIGNSAFRNCSKLTSITIPDGVPSIENYTFLDCSSLTSVTIPASVSSIGEYAFGGCLSIKDIYFNGTTAEWNELVSNSNIGLPDGVFIHTSDLIASGNCGANLTWVLNGDGLLTISGTGQMSSANTSPWSDYAASVLTAQINSGATSIGDSAFKDCSNLTNIAIPSSVTKIGRRSFMGCSSLTTITIPSTVTTIDVEAFDGLQEIYGNECSTAHRFAVQHNIAFEPVEGDSTVHIYGQPEWRWANDYSSAQAVYTCSNCHMEHTADSVITQNVTAATCMAAGQASYIAAAEFNGYSVTDVKTVTIPALGHDWGDPTYTWAIDNRTVTATRICKHDASHVETETATVTSEETKPAGCETKGETTYTAVFENSAFKSQSKVVADIDALDHDWSDVSYTWSTDNRTVTATRKCLRNASHTETETVNTVSTVTKEPTCEAKGEVTYTATFKNSGFVKQTKVLENGDAIGHSFKTDPVWIWNDDLTAAAARFYCSRCDAYEEVPGEIVDSGRTNPTHTEEGQIYASALAEYQGKDYYGYKQASIPVMAHTYGTPFWEWADDGSSASLIAECTECGARVETEATITQSGEKVEPTCSKPGQVKYLAYARYEGTRYSDTKTFTLTAEHDYGSWTYHDDSMHSRTCTNCGEVETEPHSFVNGRCKCGFEAEFAMAACEGVLVDTSGFDADVRVAAASYDADGRMLEVHTEQVRQYKEIEFELGDVEKSARVSVFYLDGDYRPIRAASTVRVLGHTWQAATCTTPKTCKICGQTEGSALGHNYVNGKCSRCGRNEGFDALMQVIMSKGSKQTDGTYAFVYANIGVSYLYKYDPSADSVKVSFTDTTGVSADFTILANMNSPYKAKLMMSIGSKVMGIYSYLYPATFTKNTSTIGYYDKTSDLSVSNATNSGITLATHIKHMLLATDQLYNDTYGYQTYNVTNLGFTSFEGAPAGNTTVVTGVSFSADTYYCPVGGSVSLGTVVSPSNATNKTVTYKSSNSSVATVDSSGNVSGRQAGTTVITATAANGISASCTVTVTDSQQQTVDAYDYLANYCKKKGTYSSGQYIFRFGASVSSSVTAEYYIFYDSSRDEVTLGLDTDTNSLAHTVVLQLSRTSNMHDLIAGYTVLSQQYVGGKSLNAKTYTGKTNIVFDDTDCPSSILDDFRELSTMGLNSLLCETYFKILAPAGYSLSDLGFVSFVPQ